MKRIEVTIQGATPLLMHRFSEEDQAQVQSGSSHAITRPTPEVAAERACYRSAMPNGGAGNLCLPARALLASIRQAAGLHRIGRRSAKSIIAASVFIQPDEIDPGVKKFEIDSQAVVIRATKGRVMRHRPRLDSWKVMFTLAYQETLLPDEGLLRRVIEDAGARVGVLDFRPACGGSFGTFVVTGWKPLK